MSTITIPKKELKKTIQESIREVLSQEVLKLRSLLIEEVSEKEQKDIERKYKNPAKTRVSGKTFEISAL